MADDWQRHYLEYYDHHIKPVHPTPPQIRTVLLKQPVSQQVEEQIQDEESFVDDVQRYVRSSYI